jgi:hypothetical protein
MSFIRLYYFKETLKFQSSALKGYIQESQNILNSKQRNLDEELKTALAQISNPDEEQQIINFFLDDNLQYYDDFPKYLNESTFLIIYSFFETKLATICRLFRIDIEINKKKVLPHSKGSYFNDSENFLKDVCKLKLGADKKFVKRLNQLRRYRNFITHNDSDFKHIKSHEKRLNHKKNIDYINRVFGKSIVIDSLKKCSIKNEKLIPEFLNLVEEYLYYVIDTAIKKLE